MNSKVFLTGRTFRETCNYVAEDKNRAQILDVEGVRGHDPELMAKDFEVQLGFLPKKEKPVFHAVLSFPDGERPADQKLVEIAREYLEEIKMTHTQFAVVKHIDTAHLHLHIVANKVNNEGEIIGKGMIIERGMRAAQKLTRKHGLTPERGKNLALTNFSALREPDVKRYQIYQAIQKHLPKCVSFADLEKRLLWEGILMRFRRDRLSGQIQGVSFRKEQRSFAGKKVDPACSFKSLQQTLTRQLELQQTQSQQPDLQQKQSLRPQQTLTLTNRQDQSRDSGLSL